MGKASQSSSPDPLLGFQAAEAFYSCAMPFITRMGPNKESAAGFSAGNMGDLTASATNLALALELYLKTLQAMAGMQPTRVHDLGVLFKRLPLSVKEELRRQYVLAHPQASHRPATIELEVSTESSFEGERRSGSQLTSVDDTTLDGLLTRCSDAFRSWRYMYESGAPGFVTVLRYEFGNMQAACTALRMVILPVFASKGLVQLRRTDA